MEVEINLFCVQAITLNFETPLFSENLFFRKIIIFVNLKFGIRTLKVASDELITLECNLTLLCFLPISLLVFLQCV